MQSFRSRSVSSDMQSRKTSSSPNPMRSLSPSSRKSSLFSPNSIDSRPSNVPERKTLPKSQSFREQWAQLQEELKRAKEERSIALRELEELKKKRNEESSQSKDRIKMLELEAEKAKESEGKMLESLSSQTKQLEQTKISLEEAKLEIKNLPFLSSQKLQNELRLALEAEEKSKKAMDDLAIALKEVTIDAKNSKSQLSATKFELEKARTESQDALKLYHELKQENEESFVAWKEKEESFINCIKIFEEDVKKKDKELSRLTNSHRIAREENSLIKESLEIARYQNYDLEKQLSKKEDALQQIRQDYESLKVSEAASLDSVKELKSMIVSVSAPNSSKSSNLSEFESFPQSKSKLDDRKISRGSKKFSSSDRWTDTKSVVQKNGQRHSVGESLNGSKDGCFSIGADVGIPSFLFSDDRGLNTDDFDHLNGMIFSDSENEKKKKTALQRFGDVLMRRSTRRP